MPDAGAALSLEARDGKLVTTLGGVPVRTPSERFTYLKSKRGDLCHDVTLDELVPGKKLKLPEKARLLVVRTTEIDTLAHGSPRAVLTMIPSVLRQLIKGIARVEAAGFQKVVVATDHGFILVHEQEAGNVAPKPAGDWVVQKSRCLARPRLSQCGQRGTQTRACRHSRRLRELRCATGPRTVCKGAVGPTMRVSHFRSACCLAWRLNPRAARTDPGTGSSNQLPTGQD